MELSNLIEELKHLLEEEKEILMKFPVTNPDEFLKIQEEKRKLLLNISKFSKKELIPFQEKILEILELNSTISALLTNHISSFEEFEKELFGEMVTYKESKKPKNLFNGKV